MLATRMPHLPLSQCSWHHFQLHLMPSPSRYAALPLLAFNLRGQTKTQLLMRLTNELSINAAWTNVLFTLRNNAESSCR